MAELNSCDSPGDLQAEKINYLVFTGKGCQPLVSEDIYGGNLIGGGLPSHPIPPQASYLRSHLE